LILYLGAVFWVARCCLYVLFQVPEQASLDGEDMEEELLPVEKIIDLSIIIIIMPDAPQALDVVPAGPPEQGGVYTGVPAHGPVGQVVDCPELVVQ
jgi:hypothetical protein